MLIHWHRNDIGRAPSTVYENATRTGSYRDLFPRRDEQRAAVRINLEFQKFVYVCVRRRATVTRSLFVLGVSIRNYLRSYIRTLSSLFYRVSRRYKYFPHYFEQFVIRAKRKKNVVNVRDWVHLSSATEIYYRKVRRLSKFLLSFTIYICTRCKA